MALTLAQTAVNAIRSFSGRTCRVVLTRPTAPLNLVVIVAAANHPGSTGTFPLEAPAGFTLAATRREDELTLAVWFRAACPSLTSVSVSNPANRSLVVRVVEYSGAAQSNVLDKVTIRSGRGNFPSTGATGTTSQGDEVVLGAVANRYASTRQLGFFGGLTRLTDTVTPSAGDVDDRRSRLTIHQRLTTSPGSFSLAGILSSSRDWVAVLATFRGGTSGPARMSSTDAAPMLATTGGAASLTVFGPLRSTPAGGLAPMLATTAAGIARIGPFNHQYLLGGWSGLLIGAGTEFRVESVEGLEGWDVRTSDDDLPRGDGSLRGVDLQSARLVALNVNVASSDPAVVEERMARLKRAAIPQRDADLELIWRHPGQPLKLLRYRPTSLVRMLDRDQVIVNRQPIALRAADPRHYSASLYEVEVAVTPAGALDPTLTSVVNRGSGPAHPLIRVQGPSFGEPLSRMELLNTTNDVAFVVAAVLPGGSMLVGDMEARATGAARSVVTIDGQTKYGAWGQPRQTFQLNPGANLLSLRTEPAGAPVRAFLIYRDTSSG